MKKNDFNNAKDPVCLMKVDQGSFELEYQEVSYSFCSQQCHDRFKMNPHLYIGRPGKPSPKQQGQSVIRKRRLKLEETAPEHIQQQIMEILNTMMGIKSVSIEDNNIFISYDLLEVTEQQIEIILEKNGGMLSKTWSTRLKRAFTHFIEDNELDNLEQGNESHGCHGKDSDHGNGS
ncbi:MAG: YHS domain-containing protein [Gammaproteobacteria bacterium]|nr:YHS domain-containing protein [Gammaproteobacteria bacterium]